MTIGTYTPESYAGDGSTTTFAVDFIFWENTDLLVTHRDANDNETTWVLGTHYTTTGGSGATGTVEATNAPASGEKLFIKSNIPLTQVTPLPLGGEFPSTTVEEIVDRNNRKIQQLQEQLDRAVKLSDASDFSISDLPDPIANTYLSSNAANELAWQAISAISGTAQGCDETSTDTNKTKLISNNLAKRADEAARSGGVRMYRTSSGVWRVLDGVGDEIDISSSTTDGLQEAINSACNNGYDLFVYGGGHKTTGGTNEAVITCTTGIDWPTMQGNTIWFGGVDIQFTSAVGSANGFDFDSCMGVNFQFNGEIIYQGTSAAILFSPRNNVPLDGITTIVDSVFHFNTVGSTATAGQCVRFVPTSGNIGRCAFSFVEVIDSSAGIQIENSATYFTTQNWIKAVGIHDQDSGLGNVGLKVGNSTTNSGSVVGNFFDVSVNVAGSTAIDVYGETNIIRCVINHDSGTTQGIALETSATGNKFEVVKNNTSTPVNDASTAKDNEGMYGLRSPRFSVNKGGTNQTGVTTGTFTKVTFGTEAYDRGAAFDSSTNHRWTPGRIGTAHLDGCVSWTTAVDADSIFIAIYRNGTLHRQSQMRASGTSAQCSQISADVDVAATTDYFELFVQQNSGSDKVIDGTATITWFMGHFID